MKTLRVANDFKRRIRYWGGERWGRWGVGMTKPMSLHGNITVRPIDMHK